MADMKRPMPEPTPETLHFREGRPSRKNPPAMLRPMPLRLFSTAPFLPKVRVAQSVGGMFAASGVIVFSRRHEPVARPS